MSGKLPSWCCPYCGKSVGWIGRALAWFLGTRIHDCDHNLVKPPPREPKPDVERRYNTHIPTGYNSDTMYCGKTRAEMDDNDATVNNMYISTLQYAGPLEARRSMDFWANIATCAACKAAYTKSSATPGWVEPAKFEGDAP